jgi:hypothetical protein
MTARTPATPQIEEYWATAEPPPAWRTVAAMGAYQRTTTAA